MFSNKCILLVFIFALVFMFWYCCFKEKQENFKQQSWVETLKCLKFDNGDIEKFKELLNHNSPDYMLNTLSNNAKKKGLSDKEIFSCLTGEK